MTRGRNHQSDQVTGTWRASMKSWMNSISLQHRKVRENNAGSTYVLCPWNLIPKVITMNSGVYEVCLRPSSRNPTPKPHTSTSYPKASTHPISSVSLSQLSNVPFNGNGGCLLLNCHKSFTCLFFVGSESTNTSTTGASANVTAVGFSNEILMRW